MIAGFHRGVAEILALLGCYAANTTPYNDPEERGSEVKPELSNG